MWKLASTPGGCSVTLGPLPVSRASGLPPRLSKQADPLGPLNWMPTFWIFQLSSVSKNPLCDARLIVMGPNADRGWAFPAMLKDFTWVELFPHPESFCDFRVKVCVPPGRRRLR